MEYAKKAKALSFEDKDAETDYAYREVNSKHQGGGGVAFDENGNERPMTEDELLQELTAPDVQYEDNENVQYTAVIIFIYNSFVQLVWC